ncbi:MAG: response regulator [Ignavibacteriae bacterium]|nr:response regulator [Ignavibacteriota bacterium]
MKILIAEDDAVSKLVLMTKLQSMKFHVIAANDGREGWELYRAEHPDVVITDWMMPFIDGLEFTRMIRADRRPVYPYVIILTALGGKGSYLEGMNAGADDFITKPFDFESLNARLRVAERPRAPYGGCRTRGSLVVRSAAASSMPTQWETVQEHVARISENHVASRKCPECATRNG